MRLRNRQTVGLIDTGDAALLHHPSAGHEVPDEGDDREHYQEMNEAAGDMKDDKAHDLGNQQDQRNNGEHQFCSPETRARS